MAARIELHSSIADSLALAMIASSATPLVLLDGALMVVAVSDSFCSAFGIDAAKSAGLPLFEIGDGEWDVPQLQSLLEATVGGYADVEAYAMKLRPKGRDPRYLVIKAHKLDYADVDNVRLLLTVSDTTDARIAQALADEILRQKDNLVREKSVLLQELQHRVANSLQIIASVILQSARRVQSTETRSHLYDAHNRVMSVAAVQQQLSVSQLGEVALRPYLKLLCRSIGSSMIHDPQQITLNVEADDALTSSDVSVSMGLIVTELVINALKHAFPAHRKGQIKVGYRQHDTDQWTLSVADNGVGMPKDRDSAKPGLGTSIVEALARQLGADIHVTDIEPGTVVSVVHGSVPNAAAAHAV